MDGHSGVRGLTNSSGSLTDSYAYGAFGDLKNSTGTTANNYRYTGQQFDSLTGLYSLRSRYYNPSEGRFNSRDTWQINLSNPGELNRYGYVTNNPINKYDPSGLNETVFLMAKVSVATNSAIFTTLIVAPLLLHLNVTFILGRFPETECVNDFVLGKMCTFSLDRKATLDLAQLLRQYASFYRNLGAILTATPIGALLSYLGFVPILAKALGIASTIMSMAGLALLAQNPDELDALATKLEGIAGSNNNTGRAKVRVKGIKSYEVFSY
jgi:RHS repeat-associated protein